jgi:hypothetical protein
MLLITNTAMPMKCCQFSGCGSFASCTQAQFNASTTKRKKEARPRHATLAKAVHFTNCYPHAGKQTVGLHSVSQSLSTQTQQKTRN